MQESLILKGRVRALVSFFMLALAGSGLTAIPLRAELELLNRLAGPGSFWAARLPELGSWIGYVRAGLRSAGLVFPQISYGTDWLAFAHVAIAVAFVGLLIDPVRNRWVIEWAMIVCGLLVPWALALGALRAIPWFWQLVDCSFGCIGFLPLWLTRRYIQQLARLTQG